MDISNQPIFRESTSASVGKQYVLHTNQTKIQFVLSFAVGIITA